MRLLQWLRPRIDIAELGEAPVECKWAGPRPSLLDEIMRLIVARPNQSRRIAVTTDIVHRRADRKSRHEAAATNAVEQRVFLGHPDRRLIHRDRISEHNDGSIGLPLGEYFCD